MSKDPAFLFYPKDWITGTAALMPIEKGVYIDFLCYQHQNGQLPLEHARLARIAGMSVDEFEVVWNRIKDKFIMEDYGYTNKRLRMEMDNRFISAKKKRIAAMFAIVIRQNDISREDLKEIKKSFSIDDFMQFPDEDIHKEIIKWVTTWSTIR